jgi:hypothetical protein
MEGLLSQWGYKTIWKLSERGACRFCDYILFERTSQGEGNGPQWKIDPGPETQQGQSLEVLASPDKVDIPKEENDKICQDLQQALLLGERPTKMVANAMRDYCHIISPRQ